MLRDNFDKLRDQSRDERERRDARNYYLADNDLSYNSSQSSGEQRNQPQNRRRAHNDFGDHFYQDPYDQQNQAYHNWTEGNLEETSRSRTEDAQDEQQRRARDLQNSRANQASNQRYEYEDRTNYTRDTERHWADTHNLTQASPFYPANTHLYENREMQNRQLIMRGAPEQNYQNRNSQDQGVHAQNHHRDLKSLRAQDIMSRNVVTVMPNDTVQHTARLMRDCDCGAIPVVDRQGRMLGMITDRDITIRLVAGGFDLRGVQVQDCMTDQAFACHASESLEACLNAMSQRQVRRIVVLDDQNHVTGIISQSDLARFA